MVNSSLIRPYFLGGGGLGGVPLGSHEIKQFEDLIFGWICLGDVKEQSLYNAHFYDDI